mmetsp:Transcript_32440/g.31716  ORF Transcript_32440/g.31716 Transcript_32440/m.31716 type:complete len:134 (-) Transcript_32440:277-678(-)
MKILLLVLVLASVECSEFLKQDIPKINLYESFRATVDFFDNVDNELVATPKRTIYEGDCAQNKMWADIFMQVPMVQDATMEGIYFHNYADHEILLYNPLTEYCERYDWTWDLDMEVLWTLINDYSSGNIRFRG